MNIWIYIAVMAGVTYLIRMLPLTLFQKKIESNFVKSFLFYVPYAVLAVMTVPAIFESTANAWSALAGFFIAGVCAYLGAGLLPVALAACIGVYFVELILRFWT